MMTSRERLLATFCHERPDRVPLDGWFRPELVRQLEARLGREWQKALGLDWGGGGHCGMFWPQWDARRDLAVRKGDWPGAAQPYYWHDERTYEDHWGVIHRVGTDGKYTEWVSGPLSALDADSSEACETASRVVPVHDFASVDSIAERIRKIKMAGGLAIGGIPLPFERAWNLRGMENLFCDFLANPDFVHALMEPLHVLFTEQVRRMAAAGADVITVIGDIACQDRLLFSREIFQEFMKPALARMVQVARAAAPPGHRIYWFYHCDGDMSSVLPDFIEDLEYDIINPIQPECMDCYDVKRRYGNRITIHGTLSVVDLIPKGPVQRIREAVRERIDRLAYNGGFVLSSANVIGFDTPVEHVLAMYEEAQRYTSDRWPRASWRTGARRLEGT